MQAAAPAGAPLGALRAPARAAARLGRRRASCSGWRVAAAAVPGRLSAAVADARRARPAAVDRPRASAARLHPAAELRGARQHPAAGARHRHHERADRRAAGVGDGAQRHAVAPCGACAGGALLHHAALSHRARLHHPARARTPDSSIGCCGPSFGFESGPHQHLQHAGRDLRHRHPRLRLHLFPHLQRAEVGRRLARGIGADAGCASAGRRRCASTCRWSRRRSPAARCWPPSTRSPCSVRRRSSARRRRSCSCRRASTPPSAAIRRAGARRPRCRWCWSCSPSPGSPCSAAIWSGAPTSRSADAACAPRASTSVPGAGRCWPSA